MKKSAVILAGGLGKRLEPFTKIIPKPLLPIGEKAVLEIQIEHFKKHEFNNIYVATNYKSEYIESFLGDGSRYGVNVKISKESKALGTAGPLKLLVDELKNPFIVINGDILSSINFTNLYSFAINIDAILAVGIKKIVTPYSFGNIFFKDNFVTEIQEKPDFITYALAGIYVMKPEILNFIPDDEYFGMDSLINKLLKKNIHVAKYEVNEYWIDIGRIDDYNEAMEVYNNIIKDEKIK